MAIRNILPDTEEILHKQCKTVKAVDIRIKSLVDDMIETLSQADGVGLAAPQIGVLKRVCVIDGGEEHGFLEFINPEMIEKDGTQEASEACLSIKGFEGHVIRPLNIKVKATNKNGEEFIFEASEFLARVICHEMDHLEGKTIKDVCEYEVEPIDETTDNK